MEFFNIDYCNSVIEYNKIDKIQYDINELEFINKNLQIDINNNVEFVNDKSVFINKLKQYNFTIIKNILELHAQNKKYNKYIELLNTNGLLYTEIKIKYIIQKIKLDNLDRKYEYNDLNIIKNIIFEITNPIGNKKIIPNIKKIFNISNTKNMKINIFYSILKCKDLIIDLYKNTHVNKNIVEEINVLMYKISYFNVYKLVMNDIKMFGKLKNKMNTYNEKLAKSVVQILNREDICFRRKNNLKRRINNLIYKYKKIECEYDIKVERLYVINGMMTERIKLNNSLVDLYKNDIINIKEKSINLFSNINKSKLCKEFNKDDDITCPICLENIDIGIQTKCNHKFHLSCMNVYIHSKINSNMDIDITCPLCRLNI